MSKSSKKRRPSTASKKGRSSTTAAGKKSKRRRSSAGPRGKRSQRTGDKAPEPVSDEAAFTETLIESGQAARLDENGRLPAGATHKIVEENGEVKIVRRRFSIT